MQSRSKISVTTLYTLILMGVTAVLLITSGIIYKQTFLRILPLCNSLVISFLTSRADRRAFFLGACNSVLYAVVYFGMGLYAMAVYAITISTSMQLITFFRWRSRPSGKHSTIFQRMDLWQRMLLIIGFAACWGALYLILSLTDSSYQIWDNTITLVGILSAVLAIFPFVEYLWFMVASGVTSIILYIDMIGDDPAQITFLIYAVYSLICTLLALRTAVRLYKGQKADREAAEAAKAAAKAAKAAAKAEKEAHEHGAH